MLAELRALLRLDDGPRRVLVVEDDGAHYDAMVRWLWSEGHTPYVFGRVHDLREGVLIGMTLDEEPTSVHVAMLDVAFLDFYFPSEPWNGGRLARALIAENPAVRVFGMSSVAPKNDEMVRAGALGGMLKRELRALLPR